MLPRTLHQRLAETLAATDAARHGPEEIERAMVKHWPDEEVLRRKVRKLGRRARRLIESLEPQTSLFDEPGGLCRFQLADQSRVVDDEF